MAATVQAQFANSTGPTLTNAESSGVTWNRDDTQTGVTPVPIPTATGTKYSYLKYLALVVTGTAATAISNRRLSLSTGAATGLFVFFKDQATYTQNNGTQGASAGNYPADSGSNGATPAGYTMASTSLQLWDNTSVSAGGTGKNGDYVQCVFGVDHTFVGGPGNATAMPGLTLTYDEA